MSETFSGDVLHVIPPGELGEHDRTAELQALAESRYVLVCRAGGQPSWLGLLWATIRRDPIEATTIVTDEPAAEGDQIAVPVEETELPGVYTAVTE
ncbi:DUF7526 family protein [Halobaculum sp. D14]|uniref:DUF7526 family protein n=1 Tax=Halobaculum sp. D14 TaxID=3421642 RepID=UPI003EB9A294